MVGCAFVITVSVSLEKDPVPFLLLFVVVGIANVLDIMEAG